MKYVYPAMVVAVFFAGFFLGNWKGDTTTEENYSVSSQNQKVVNHKQVSGADEQEQHSKAKAYIPVSQITKEEPKPVVQKEKKGHSEKINGAENLAENLISSMREQGVPEQNLKHIANAMKGSVSASEEKLQMEAAEHPASAMKKEEVVASFRAAGVPEEIIENMANGLMASLRSIDPTVTKEEVADNFKTAGASEQQAERMAAVMTGAVGQPEKRSGAEIDAIKTQFASSLREAGAAEEEIEHMTTAFAGESAQPEKQESNE